MTDNKTVQNNQNEQKVNYNEVLTGVEIAKVCWEHYELLLDGEEATLRKVSVKFSFTFEVYLLSQRWIPVEIHRNSWENEPQSLRLQTLWATFQAKRQQVFDAGNFFLSLSFERFFEAAAFQCRALDPGISRHNGSFLLESFSSVKTHRRPPCKRNALYLLCFVVEGCFYVVKFR